MRMNRKLTAPSERTLNRLIVSLALALALGIPTIGLFYYFDRHVDAGPTLAQRRLSAAEEAVRKEPNKLSGRILLAVAYMTAKRYDDAIVQYTEVLKAQPDNRAGLLGRGQAYLLLENLDAAQKDYQAMIDQAKGGEMANADPQLEAAYFNLGAIALKRDQPKDAQKLLESALRIIATDADALNLLGTALLENGDPKQAVEALRKAVSFVPTGWCEPYNQLDRAYTALGQAGGARYAAGMAAFCEGRPDEAKQKLQALTDGPFAIDAMLGLGLIAEDQGDVAGATEMYTKVVAHEPRNFIAISGLNRLGATPAPASPTPPTPAGSPTAGGTN